MFCLSLAQLYLYILTSARWQDNEAARGGAYIRTAPWCWCCRPPFICTAVDRTVATPQGRIRRNVSRGSQGSGRHRWASTLAKYSRSNAEKPCGHHGHDRNARHFRSCRPRSLGSGWHHGQSSCPTSSTPCVSFLATISREVRGVWLLCECGWWCMEVVVCFVIADMGSIGVYLLCKNIDLAGCRQLTSARRLILVSSRC